MTWAREALRTISSSLLAPAALLAAALVVAVGGSGADALGSLGQLGSGPDAPLSTVGSVKGEGTADANLSELAGRTLASTRSVPSSLEPSNPLGEPLDQTRQQLDDLLQPVEPITDEMLGGLGR